MNLAIRKLAFIFLALPLIFTACQEEDEKGEKITYFQIETDFGKMRGKLYNETPQHRDNFIKLANEGYYNGTLFHRVIQNFMIQGGDPQSVTAEPEDILGNGEPGYTIPAEIKDTFFHKKGALAAARKGDNVNPKRASSGSQFYVVQGQVWNDQQLNMISAQTGVKISDEHKQVYKTLGGTPFLDQQYTVFGEIIEGLDIIDSIAMVQKGKYDRPLTDIEMKVKILKWQKADEEK